MTPARLFSGPPRPFATLMLTALGVAPCTGQDIETVRRQLSDELRRTHFMQSLLGLVLVSDEIELSGANYRLDNADRTRINVIAAPFHSTRSPWGEQAPRLYLEGSIGFAEAHEKTADLYAGTAPGFETSTAARWRTYGALFGAGLQFDVARELTLTPIVDVAVSRIESDARFGGPGAAVTAALLDGIALNWDAMAVTYGGAMRVGWQHPFDAEHRVEVLGRYDVRWTETFDEDDPAQDFVARSQLITLRADVFGPTGTKVFGQPLDWQLTTAYRYFPEQTLFEADSYVEFGGSLLLQTADRLPVGHGMALSAAVFYGEDITGWTVGLRFLF